MAMNIIITNKNKWGPVFSLSHSSKPVVCCAFSISLHASTLDNLTVISEQLSAAFLASGCRCEKLASIERLDLGSSTLLPFFAWK